ncbi:MAG: glycosyltransferase family 1 protein [Coriobacteriia bacterium]|nr:glycosyltransferase family 1 protein [Coriobacteriia bacterium]
MATIGIDVTALATSASGGIGASQWATMRALARAGSEHRFIMYSTATPVVPFTEQPLYLKWPLRLGSGSSARSNIVWMQTGVNRMLAADHVDLFWSPRHLLPFRARGVATVATVQDFWHLHHPEQQPLANRTMNRLLISRILKRADHIVTTSQAVAEDAFAHYHVSRGRLTVVPLGVDAEVFRRMRGEEVGRVLERYGVPGRFLLALDVYNPRKNFSAVLEAFARLPRDLRSSLHLIGLGRRRASAEATSPAALAEQLDIGDRLVLAGDAPLEELVALYNGAEALLYPSVYEGFGMPVLEAMACGCPVITSDRSSLPEVAGGAALLTDPTDPDALAEAIVTIARDAALRGLLVQRGGQRAASLTWDATAAGMLAVFDRVLAARAGTGSA